MDSNKDVVDHTVALLVQPMRQSEPYSEGGELQAAFVHINPRREA